MRDPKNIRCVFCVCGHHALVDLAADLLTPDVIHRFRCSVCGAKEVTGVFRIAHGHGSASDPVGDYERQLRERGW